jgi:hypothetical protein
MRSTKMLFAAAAMTGLLAGSAARAAAVPAAGRPGLTKATVTSTAAGVRLAADDKGKHDCKGKNACKGEGGCKAGDNGCKGKNSCKGKGGCSSKM